MYKIIGADGREYGPASAEQIRQWIAEGRAHAQTLTQAVGNAEWKPLGSFPELLQRPTAAATPPLRASLARPSTNSSAIAGLVLGILGMTPTGWICCLPVFSILGIIFSSRAISDINRDPLHQTGKGMAVIGLVLSIVGLIWPLALATLLSGMRMFGRHPLHWHWHRNW